MEKPDIFPKTRVSFFIWVKKEATDKTGELRDTLVGHTVGSAFEVGMKYMRDEGWDSVEIIRSTVTVTEAP